MDAEAMHPSIKFALVKKAVLHCAKKLSEDEMETIVFCLELIKFSMGSTMCVFQDKCYEHIGPEGDCKVEEKGLAMGGNEAAFLADLVALHCFEMNEEMLTDIKTRCKGMCRDDGIIIFKGEKTKRDIIHFLDDFQRNVNEIAGNEFLRFAIEIWDPKNEMVDDIKHDKTKICKKKTSLFLTLNCSTTMWTI